jgi:hypothetical protein
MSLIRRETTDVMAAANRANSHASTGTVTPAGKLQARMNALDHGLRAEPARVIPELGEKDEDLLELQRQLSGRFYPHGHTEIALVEQMVENRWRRRRVRRAEAGLLVARQLRFDIDQGRALAAESRSSSCAGEARLAQEKGLASLPDSNHKFRFILVLPSAHPSHQSRN